MNVGVADHLYLSHVLSLPWAILPEKGSIIRDLAWARIRGERASDAQISAAIATRDTGRMALRGETGAVAVIPIHGTIAYRADAFEASSGGTSSELIARAVQRAGADASVSAILLDINSPGGSVEGIPELCAIVATVARTKPIVASVNALCASASYWVASQCSSIEMVPSGSVGSIGVFMLQIDESEALAKAGIKVNAISAGDNKLEGASWAPMSDDTRRYLQGRVDAVYGDFVGAVARGRGVTPATVERTYGQGRVLPAADALARGMIDRITATVDDTVARLAGSRPPGSASGARALAARGGNRNALEASDEMAILAALS